MAIQAELSSHTVTARSGLPCTPNQSSSFFKYFIDDTHLDAATYSLSMVLKVTRVCRFASYSTGDPPKDTTNPLVDLAVFSQSANDEINKRLQVQFAREV